MNESGIPVSIQRRRKGRGTKSDIEVAGVQLWGLQRPDRKPHQETLITGYGPARRHITIIFDYEGERITAHETDESVPSSDKRRYTNVFGFDISRFFDEVFIAKLEHAFSALPSECLVTVQTPSDLLERGLYRAMDIPAGTNPLDIIAAGGATVIEPPSLLTAEDVWAAPTSSQLAAFAIDGSIIGIILITESGQVLFARYDKIRDFMQWFLNEISILSYPRVLLD